MQLFRRCLLLIFLSVPLLGYAQKGAKMKIDLQAQDHDLSLLFLELKIGYRLKFDYQEEDVEDITVTTNIVKKPLEVALRMLLKGTGLSYQLAPNRTVIIRKGEQLSNAVAYDKKEPKRKNFNLSGIIKDADTGESLPFAEILVKGTSNGATTNLDGYFTLFKVPSDTSTLELHYLGYQTTYHRLDPDKSLDNLTLTMTAVGEQLDEIIVVAEREEQLLKASSGVSKISVAPAQLAALPSLGEKDIFRSLQLLPGVSGSNESSSGLYVRGGTPDQNLVLFDGFTVYHVDHLFGFFSAFNSNAIKDVQLHKGGFESKFGGRLSSVVEITGKDGNTEDFNIGGGASMLSLNGFTEIPFADGKGTVLLAGRRSFQSNFYNNIFEDFSGEGGEDSGPAGGVGSRLGNLSTTPNSYFYDLNGKLTYRAGKNIFSLSFYNGEDDLNNSRIFDESSLNNLPIDIDLNFSSDVVDETNWGNVGGSFRWSRKWGDRFYSNAVVSYSNYFSDRDRSTFVKIEREGGDIERSTGTRENNDLKDVTLKWDAEYQISGNNKLEFGLFSTRNDIDYQYVQNDSISILNRDDQGVLRGLYAQDQLSINDQLIVTAGLRLSNFDQTEATYYEPRASLVYLPTDKIKFKAAAGRYYQFANRIIREDISQGSRDFWILSDGDQVGVSSSDQLILGTSYETRDYLFDVEAYYKQLDGLTEYTTRFTTSGIGPNSSLDFQENFFSGTGVAKGIEFLAQKKSGKLSGWISYTLGSVRNDFDVFGEDPFPAAHDQTHEFKLVSTYKVGILSLAATFVYATGKPYTRPTGVYQLDLLDGDTQDLISISNKNEFRLPDYHRFDVSATLNFDNFIGGKATTGLSLYNLYNRNNVWYKEFDVVENEVVETDVTLLNFTPSVFFTWSLK
ncbi:MAG: TonB-dependent receptor [Bacteroidota bacterium]